MKIKNNHSHNEVPIANYNDTYIQLANSRILYISEDITDTLAAQLSAMLLYFDSQNHEEFIDIYIHSYGGAVSALSNIYDVMQMIKAPIKTIGLGRCYSAGAVLLAAGAKGHRYAFEHCSTMIHGIQFAFPIMNQDMTESKSYYKFIDYKNDHLMKILAHHTGHSVEKVREDCKQDHYMNAQQSKEYGLIDHIL